MKLGLDRSDSVMYQAWFYATPVIFSLAMSSIALTPSDGAGEGRLLREKVYDQLRADMIACRLAPGTEIRESELALRFGVSKSPVRDALMRLEREGLVITLPRQGYRVAPVSVADVQDMFH